MDQPERLIRLHRPLVLLAVVFALGACGSDRPDPAGSSGAESTDAVEAEGAEPSELDVVEGTPAVASSTTLPEWFPEDAFLPVDYAVAEVNENFGARQVELRLDGDITELAAQVRAGMVAAGWTETHFSAPDGTRGSNMHFTKDTRGATLSMSTAGDDSVRLVYGFTLPEPA